MANTLTFANRTITDANIFGGVSFLHDLNTGVEFAIGNTASASVTFVTDIQLPLYTKDSVNGTFTWTKDSVSRGRYYITEVTKADGKYTVTAYDAMILLDTNISSLSLSFPLTVSAAAAGIATYLGCNVSGTINNGSLSVSELDENMTIRQLLGHVAEASGCSVKIDGADHLCFMYYADSGITVTASEYVKIEVADYVCAPIDNVQIFDIAGMVHATAGSGTNTLFIQGNPFLYEASDSVAATILSLVSGFSYAPLTCEMFEENGITVGTIATFGTTPTLVMHLESSETGVTVSSVGSDSRAELNKSIDVIVNEAKEAVKSMNQHFWYVSSGTEAGAHIAEIPKAQFDVNPSGGNLLARSNGIAVRTGMTELASFSATSAVVGSLTKSHIVTGTSDISLYDDYGHKIASFGTDAIIGRTDNGYGNTRITNTSVHLRRGSTEVGFLGSSYYVNGDREISLSTPERHTYLKLYDDANNTAPYISLGLDDSSGVGYPELTIDTSGITFNGNNRVLWAGTPMYLTDTQTANLSEPIREQLNGVVFVWSRYGSGTYYNDSWWYSFVPKWHVFAHDGAGVYMSTPTGTNSSTVCIKYVYISNNSVSGHANNSATGTGYANNTRVLRAVLGV